MANILMHSLSIHVYITVQSNHPTSLFRRKVDAERAKYQDSDPPPPTAPTFQEFSKGLHQSAPKLFCAGY